VHFYTPEECTTHLAELFILPDKGMRAVSIKTKKLEPGSLFEVY
jgi:hypothetical protein